MSRQLQQQATQRSAAPRRAVSKVAPEFTVQFYDHNGRLLSEYRLSYKRQRVKCIDAAEERAIVNLNKSREKDLIIIISEESEDEFRQVHRFVAAANDAEV